MRYAPTWSVGHLAHRTQRVATLITAESIIVGLLVAFGSGVNETLVKSIERGEKIYGVVFAGLLISALAVTAFRSILLLYKSTYFEESSPKHYEYYMAGYDLFKVVIVGTGLYVIVNGFSIFNYAVAHRNVDVAGITCLANVNERVFTVAIGTFFVAWSLVAVLAPLELDRYYLRNWHGRVTIGVLAGSMIVVELLTLPLPEWQFLICWILYSVALIGIWIVSGGWTDAPARDDGDGPSLARKPRSQ